MSPNFAIGSNVPAPVSRRRIESSSIWTNRSANLVRIQTLKVVSLTNSQYQRWRIRFRSILSGQRLNLESSPSNYPKKSTAIHQYPSLFPHIVSKVKRDGIKWSREKTSRETTPLKSLRIRRTSLFRSELSRSSARWSFPFSIP